MAEPRCARAARREERRRRITDFAPQIRDRKQCQSRMLNFQLYSDILSSRCEAQLESGGAMVALGSDRRRLGEWANGKQVIRLTEDPSITCEIKGSGAAC